MTDPVSHTAHVNGMDIHYMAMGDPSAPLMLLLHGFPEFWYGWRKIMPAFADRYYVVAPDQRGFNTSSKPTEIKDYAVRNMVADMTALAELLSPGRKIVLGGHDWGASVAYAFAIFRPDVVERLIIANGVHPFPFQRELLKGGAQAKASQYIHKFRQPDAAENLLANDCAKLKARFLGFSSGSHLTPEDEAAYVKAWQQPGALEGGLNWYRASPLYIPLEGEEPDPDKALKLDPKALTVTMPHLVVWGMDDVALLPECLDGLEELAPDLRIVRVEGAGHWILHSKPEPVIAAMEEFLG